MKLFLAALVAIGIAIPAASAAPQVSGPETMNVVIVASTKAGVRTVVASVIVARGVFNGLGRIVEVDNLPGDPDNVLRDDLVFRDGSMHLRSEVLEFVPTVNPRSCFLTVKVKQRGTVEAGTGRFANATGSFEGSLTGYGTLPRTADGKCDETQSPLSEVDIIQASGTLSF